MRPAHYHRRVADNYRTIICRSCGQELTAPAPRSGLLQHERTPCPNCGSTEREYRLGFGGSITPVGDVTIKAPPAEATATALSPTVVIEEALKTGGFTRSVTWSRTSGDAWFAEVYDRDGNLVAVEVAFDAYDTLVVLSEHLLPPEVE